MGDAGMIVSGGSVSSVPVSSGRQSSAPAASQAQARGIARGRERRRRWGFVDWDSPTVRRERRELAQRLKRESFGLLEPETIQELIDDRISEAQAENERTVALRPQEEGAPAPLSASDLKDRVLAQIAREVGREIRAREEAEEAREIVEIIQKLLTRG